MDEKPICGRCRLFNPKSKRCGVLILVTPVIAEALEVPVGTKINLPVSASDECFFEQEFKAIDKDNSNVERFKVDVQEVKIWVEDPKTGQRCKQGVVKMEYPVGFFGDMDKPQVEEEEE